MLIKYQALQANLQQNTSVPIYLLTGQEPYLLNDAAYQIKKARRQLGETDEQVLHLNQTSDWAKLIEESNSYSLFAEQVLLDVRYEKKTIDLTGKNALKHYLTNSNPRCLIILRAPNVSAKQLSWLTSHQKAMVVQIYPFTDTSLKNWIATQLNQNKIRYSSNIPNLIHQFTRGNMLACAQAIEVLKLTYSPNEILSEQEVLAQLNDQCNYQLYELSDACLNANVDRALHQLRLCVHNRTEPTLVLWILTQEVRLLLQLTLNMRHSVKFSEACSKLQIWAKRAPLYQKAISRQNLTSLYQLLEQCKHLDELIKSNHSHMIWQNLESLALALCVNKNGDANLA